MAPAVGAVAAPGPTGAGGYLAPYYTEGDLTGDHQLTVEDLDLVAAGLDTADTDPGWDALAAADYDDDGVIEMTDVADLAQRILYDDGPFELVEATALDMQKAMNAGVVTSVELTQAYLDRIAAYDGLQDDTHERPLNSIITAGGQAALDAAAASDAARAENGGPRSMVDGIPVILKDNYDTFDLPTSAGHGSWEDNQTADDAFMVEGLREGGAVILAKATLDEFAFGFASEYTAGVPAGSSKLVASPYVLSRTAGGSSGGTGASIAANLGGIGFGTDTGGSIRVPSSYNQLVGVRPTVGLTSRDGIVPLALTQDTGGPITRSVSDAAIALDATVGIDPADTVTSEQDGLVPTSYTSYLDPDALDGKRIGYLTTQVGSNATTTRLFAQAVADLEAQGATVVPITTTLLNATLAESSGSTNEFKHDLNTYISDHLDPTVETRTLGDIVASGRVVPSRVTTYTNRNNVTPEQYDAWMLSHTTAITTGEALTTGLLDDNELDALMYPSGNPYGTQSTNLRLSPNTGMPSVTVPMGQASAQEAIPGAGVNLELLGRNYTEGDLLGMTYAYEQATHHRTSPPLYPALEPAAGTVPAAVPARGAAPAYAVEVSDPEVEIGDEVTVTVTTDDASDLYAFDLSLGFDPDVLAYVGGSATTDLSGATYDAVSGPGSVDVVHSTLGSSPTTSGPATLATITFRAVGEGEAAITADLLDQVAGDLTPTSTPDLGSALVAVDLQPAPVATSRPTVTGKALVGRTLRTTGGTWDLPEVALGYQWLRNGAEIPGATSRKYPVTPGDAGARLAVQVSAALPDHATGIAVSSPTTKVVRAATTTRWSLKPGAPRAGVRPVVDVQVKARGITPSGSVLVRYAGRVIASGQALRSGTTSVRLPRKTAGRYSLRVVFRPDAGFAPSTKVRTVKIR